MKRGKGCLLFILYLAASIFACSIIKQFILPGPERTERAKLLQPIPPLKLSGVDVQTAFQHIMNLAPIPVHVDFCRDLEKRRIFLETDEPLPLGEILRLIGAVLGRFPELPEDIYHGEKMAVFYYSCPPDYLDKNYKNFVNSANFISYQDFQGSIHIIVYPSLYEAAMKGNSVMMRKLLLSGMNPNQGDFTRYWGSQRTAIMVAAEKGYQDIVQMLIEAGADVNKKDPTHNTALILAAARNNTDCVRILAQAGADVNPDDLMYGETTLHDAARNGNIAMAKILIEAGADLNAINYKGNSPLMLAHQNGFKDMEQFLLNAGATDYAHEDYHMLFRRFWTPFRQAIRNIIYHIPMIQ